MTDKQRILTQNAAIHVYFDLLAKELNTAGYDMKRTLKESVDIPWNGATVKEYLWKPIQNAQVMKKSTTELTTKEIDEIYETLNRHLGETTGVTVAFPSKEE